MLELKNISKKFKNFIVFDSINFKFEKGKIYLITGPNGSGKTTLLKIISGYLTPDGGEIYFENKKLNYKKYNFNLFSFIQDTTYFYPQLNSIENIRFFLNIRNKKFDIEKFKTLSKSINFKEDDLQKKFSELSNGNKLKAMTVKAFLEDSEVILIDEGFKSLDINSLDAVKKILKEKSKDKIILIATTNPKNFLDIANEILTIKDKGIFKKSYE